VKRRGSGGGRGGRRGGSIGEGSQSPSCGGASVGSEIVSSGVKTSRRGVL